MDDLLALFDAAIADSEPTESAQLELDTPSLISTRPPLPNTQQQDIHHPMRTNLSCTTRDVNQRTASTDNDLYGIRMINRKISSIDLMNRMIDYPFHSAAQLCAAPLSTLNTLLVEPTAIVDVATVNGKTHLWTLGIVFMNTGSRIGPSGKAYCMLTIGTLTTGPSVTIMLFGNSYLTYCRTVRSGMVIALINPRLLSPRTAGNPNRKDRTAFSSSSSSNTILTFSIYDKDQLLVLGDSQDYGRCKATTSSKNEHGQWIPNSKACSNYVDKRQGDYCQHHRKLQHKTLDVSSKNIIQSGKISSLQQLRTQAAAFPMVRSDQMNKTIGTKFVSARNHQITPSPKTPLMAIHQQLQGSIQSLQNKYTPHQSKNPLLSAKTPLPAGSIDRPDSMNPTSSKAVNPYTVRRNEQQTVHLKTKSIAVKPPQVTRNALQTIDILQLPPKRSTCSDRAVTKDSKKRRLVNTDTTGFNGSVAIPAPAKMFSVKNVGLNPAATLGHLQDSQRDPNQRTEHVIVQQKMIASQLRSGSVAVQPKYGAMVFQDKPKSTNETHNDDLFGSHFDSTERENIINAKSMFTSEVEAEEYARSRRIVCELEEQEFKATNKVNAKNQKSNVNTPAILKEWYCHVCKKRFSQEPIQCLRLQHRIRVERDLRAQKSKVEERLAMTEAKTEDGGLVLGTGLDWSRFPSSRFG